jgi:hypothetical protein
MIALSARALPLLLVALSCTSEPPEGTTADDAADVLDVSPGGAADESGFPVIEVGGAGRYPIDVAALPPGVAASLDNLEGVVHAFELRLPEAGSVAFVARATSGDVDPHVVLKSTSNETLATGRDQSFLPMAEERDAVVTIEAESETDYVFVVADEELAHAGSMVVDVVVFSETLGIDLGWTHAGTRAITEMLREREPELAGLLSDGVVLEDMDGYVSVGDLTPLPLSERAGVNGLISNVNELRGLLYEEYSEERPDAVGRAAAELYWALRNP